MNYYKINTGIFPDVIKICFSNEQFQQILKDHDIKEKATALEIGVAETHYLRNHYTGIIIGAFNLEEMGDEVSSVSGTIAHEASHIIDRMAEIIGEDHIVNEVRAYFTQFLVENIWKCIITEREKNVREQNRKLSKQAGKEKRRAKSKVDQHSDGSAGPDSVSKPKDIPSRTEISYWSNIAQTENNDSRIRVPRVPHSDNRLF